MVLQTQNRLVTTEQGAGSSLWVRLERPDSSNAIDELLLADLREALLAVHETADIRSVVITGSGRAFCAGADITQLLHDGTEIEPNEFVDYVRRVGETFKLVTDLPMPVIAAVNGAAVGGGLELAMCCDLIVAARTARLGDGHANMGGLPGYGGSVRLARLVGRGRAKYLAFTGDLLGAEDAQAWGLVHAIAEPEDLEADVQRLCETIAGKSPLGLNWMKRLIDEGSEQDLGDGLAAELTALKSYVHSHDLREGIRSFVEKRDPEFRGE